MTSCPPVLVSHTAESLRLGSIQFSQELKALGITPFGSGDSSAGMEYELQVAVEGKAADVDLPISIYQSNFFRNIEKRVGRGDLPPSSIEDIRQFLDENRANVWENSWVRIKKERLGPLASRVFSTDLLADKRYPKGPQRGDSQRFHFQQNDRSHIRIPISYLLKLAFAEILDQNSLPESLESCGHSLFSYFQSDNTSPEILSFTIPSAQAGAIGPLAARETARTFLLTQLLGQFANSHYGLKESGQRAIIYNAPHAPYRQKRLNDLVPDGYYRHLFMSPCLSGWERGEEKHKYMALCHRTLSRSQLNTISKLKDAGIITNNLIVLPNTSNTCLANNGTHVSLGSSALTRLATDPGSSFTPGVEKYMGDLVIKIVEHFLPLFAGTYTAAPYRVDFADFHPESVLGFLPHELDYTHLRMLWRRWKKKADIQFCGRSFTPFGPRKLDNMLSKVLGLSGDLIPDFRLIDYFITLLSTESCPALDGMPGNQERLKAELAEIGIFDSRMSIYLPYRMRAQSQMGYSGFEGRIYSLFPSFLEDMVQAVELQNLVTAVAYSMVLDGKVVHQDIPDLPPVESERRQMFFATAIGVPTVYIRTNSSNMFLKKILKHVKQQRHSKRYRNYLRIKVSDYQQALISFLKIEGAELTDQLQATPLLDNLHERLTDPGYSASGKLVCNSIATSGDRRKPTKIPADIFNAASEEYYRNDLKEAQCSEGLAVLEEDCLRLEQSGNPIIAEIMCTNTQARARSVTGFFDQIRDDVLEETAAPEDLVLLLHLGLAVVHDLNNQR
ncbi:hypothetical protein [Desulfosediminicola sp.]|uniref:hypothetical protein n=1 Tax=Desulfosediminicola sp. TaxID=2886825 RepID=UPI003AF2917B